jgi:hypothetical protein
MYDLCGKARRKKRPQEDLDVDERVILNKS